MSFSIDMKDAGAAFEQGVQAPSATEYGAAARGLQSLSQGLLSIGTAVASQQRGGPTQSSVDRANLGKFITTLQEKTRGVEDLDQLSSITNGLLTQFIATSGQKPDAAIFDAIQTVTGLDKSTVTFNAETAGYNEAVSLIQDKQEFLFLAERELQASQADYNNQDILNLAIEKVKINEAAMASLTLNRNVSEAKFVESLPLFDQRVDDLVQLAGAALEIERQGGNVDPEFTQRRLTSVISQMRATFRRPPNVSAEAYQPVEDQLNALD